MQPKRSTQLDKEYIRAQRIAFQLLKFRARSQKEISYRLKRKKISQKNITRIIDFLKKVELLDDNEFARSWVKSGISRRLGTRRISFELKQKGVEREIIEEAIDAIKDRYKESDVALELAKKKLADLKNIDKVKAKQRIYGFLARRGFSFDVVNEVIQEL